ncbi:FecR domain-containing protein [Pseudomonas sp. R2.Fl]|nr:FecR domain-containing protein [Pseudomonas sp. R2.Fl]
MTQVENGGARNPNQNNGYVHPDPVTDAALDWLLCLQAAPRDRPLAAEFARWRLANPAHGEAYDRLVKTWQLPELDAATVALARQRDDLPVYDDAPRFRTARAARWLGAVAAAILLAIGLRQYPEFMIRWQADYVTETGAKQDVVLPDGSRMTLNTGTAVDLDFEAGRRSVKLLRGEAFFDVVHDPARPFTVAGRFSEVEVKGTAFSVKTDADEDFVVLERGLVQVAHLPERTETAFLDPGESIAANASSLSPVSRVDASTSLAWLEGRIVFDERKFSSVLDDLKRYYPGPVILANDRVGEVMVSGNYRLTDPEGTIRSLATAAGAGVTRLPGGILILR